LSSQTHGIDLPNSYLQPADVAIHCGNFTTESKLDKFETAIRLLERIDAPLNPAIAGNPDFTLDTPMFKKKVAGANEH
jgi:predicted phosphodiesterase